MVDKFTKAPTQNELIDKVNEVIDNLGGGGGGTATDVQINGTSITSNNVANIVTNIAYNASSNKIATMSDLGGKANVALSNINQTAKNTVINTIMPDYANGISYTYTTAHTDQTYTMPNDGVLYYTLTSYKSNDYPAYIKVNGYTVNYMGSSGQTTAQVAMGNINVNKNDIITVNSYYTNAHLTKITFFPMKGAA